MNTVEAFEAMLKGKVSAVVNLGGNLVRSVPDRTQIEPAWRELPLVVNIATKLNRSHLVHGKISYVLPCLSRIEIDRQAGGPQAVSMEDSTGCVHGSHGVIEPAGDSLRSEPFIIAEIAKATLGANSKANWDAWRDDYSLVRDAIAETFPEVFHDFNARMWTPGGFPRPLPARERKWNTRSGKAEFAVPQWLNEDPDMPAFEAGALRLMTLRGDNQFNTTIYSLDDRFRGVKGSRMVLLMAEEEMSEHGVKEGDIVTLETIAKDGIIRRVEGFSLKAYDIPKGCIGGYYPECNPLLPLWHCAKESKVPAAKSIPVRMIKS